MNTSSPDRLAPDQVLAKWDELHGHHEVTDALGRLREAHPEMDSITAEVTHGVIVDGVTIEVHVPQGIDFAVKAKTAEAACDLALAEFDRQRSEGQSYVWPPRFDD